MAVVSPRSYHQSSKDKQWAHVDQTYLQPLLLRSQVTNRPDSHACLTDIPRSPPVPDGCSQHVPCALGRACMCCSGQGVARRAEARSRVAGQTATVRPEGALLTVVLAC